MQEKDVAVLVALEQAQVFLDTNASLLQSVNSTDTRKALDDVITQLSTGSVAQSANTQLSIGATAAQLAARRTLLEHYMRAVVAVARAQLPTLPQLAGLAKAAGGKVSNKGLLDAASGMAQVIAEHRDVFVAALGPDFLDQLASATNDLKSSGTLAKTTRAQRSAATSGIDVQVRRGRKVLRVLDPMVKRALAGNTQLLADWQNRLKIVGPSRPAGTSAAMPVQSTTEATTPSQGGATPAPMQS